jgi:hypothetical protein
LVDSNPAAGGGGGYDPEAIKAGILQTRKGFSA